MTDVKDIMAAAGVFKGADSLPKFVNKQEFWDKQPYSNRLYFGDNVDEYITRGHFQTAIEALTHLSEQNAAKDKEIAELRRGKQSMYHSLYEILYYEGGADNALEDEYVMERLKAVVDEYREPCDLQIAVEEELGRPVKLQNANGCAEDRLKRCVSGAVAGDGSCIACFADQGVQCYQALSLSEGKT